MPRNPFELPEIRGRLALFVSVKDAISCMQVSKAFSQDFAYPIWHTIDLKTQKKFTQLDPATSNKYGQYIRVVKGIENQSHLSTLMGLRATELSILEAETTMDALFQANLYDLIRKNQATLTQLNIANKSPKRTSSKFIFLDCLTPMTDSHQPSKLTILIIRWLTLTRDSLTSILRCCPALETMDLLATTLIPSRNFDDYQHTGVKTLVTFITDAVNDGNSPLLVHFPNLIKWKTSDNSEPSAFPTQKVKDGIFRWCPKPRHLESVFTPASLLAHFLTNVFFGLSSLIFDYQNISSEVILALLRYPDNWVELRTYATRRGYYDEFEQDGVPEVQDHFQSSGWTLKLIMRCCRNLKSFGFLYHEMDMDHIDQTPWSCKDLETLSVRIKGLDTRDTIEGAITRWTEGRNLKKLKEEIKDLEEEDVSIEARVGGIGYNLTT